MKIGIITLSLHTNYGGILQAYALQTVLERIGHKVVVLDKGQIQHYKLWEACWIYPKRFITKFIKRRDIDIFARRQYNKIYPIISQYTQPFIDKYIHPKDKGNRSLFGDAAAATLVSTDGFAEIGDFVLGTDGNGAENLIVKTGASRRKELDGNLRLDEGGCIQSDDFLYMNGSEIFNFTLEVVSNLMSQVLKKNNIDKKEVYFYVFHQANKFMLNTIRKVCMIPQEQFYIQLANTGNTVSSTLPIALKMQ